jgi:hypothetical protein
MHKMLSIVVLRVVYEEFGYYCYAEFHTDKCRYVDCHKAESRGAFQSDPSKRLKQRSGAYVMKLFTVVSYELSK